MNKEILNFNKDIAWCHQENHQENSRFHKRTNLEKRKRERTCLEV